LLLLTQPLSDSAKASSIPGGSLQRRRTPSP
jgi:hypothetical protein